MDDKTGSATTPFICGLDAALRIISGKWKLLIIFFLGKGPFRYGELKRSVRGVSEKVLINQLRDLEAHGVVRRTDYKEIPPRVVYELTPFGTTLVKALRPLCDWGEENQATIAETLADELDQNQK